MLENAVVIKRAASRWSRGDSLACARLTCSRGQGWAVTQGGGYKKYTHIHKNNAQNESEESINWKLKNREVGKIAAERLLFPLEWSSGNKMTEPDGRSSSYWLWCFWTGQSSLFFLSFFFRVGRNSIFFWAGQQLNWMGRLFAEKTKKQQKTGTSKVRRFKLKERHLQTEQCDTCKILQCNESKSRIWPVQQKKKSLAKAVHSRIDKENCIEP